MPEIVLVYHDMAETDDRASAWLGARGWRTRAVCPAEGDRLPELSEAVSAAVVYGGRYDVRDMASWPFLTDEMRWIEAALQRQMPILGLCLGAQLMANVLGEPVGPHPDGAVEYGYYPLMTTDAGEKLFGDDLTVLQSHWHGWFKTPRGAEELASTERFRQAFRYGTNAYAFQFHPEASLASLKLWIGRRGERNFMPVAFPPDRQLADHARFDRALGEWLERFLEQWIGPAERMREAAE